MRLRSRLSWVWWCSVSAASLLQERTAHLPPANDSWSVQVLGNGNDTSFNPYIYRDGGGGITFNGYNMIVFSDTSTNCKGYNQGFCGFASNTAVYYGQKNESDPLNWTDFGIPPTPRQVVPFMSNETTNSTRRTLIWPDTRYVPFNSSHAVGFVSVGEVFNGTVELANGTYLYNSLVYLSMNATGPTFARSKPQFFYGDEVLYGTFSVERSNDSVYLFAYNIYGAKLARVDLSNIEDRSLYQYWDGTTWTDNIPNSADPATNVWNYTTTALDGRRVGPLHGDCFVDNYHESPMCIFTDGGVSGIFYATWSKTGRFEGPWYDAVKIFEPPHPPDPQTYTYAGHAYPGWDATGRTLLLSYSWGGALTQMALITWDSQNSKAASTSHASPDVKPDLLQPLGIALTVAWYLLSSGFM